MFSVPQVRTRVTGTTGTRAMAAKATAIADTAATVDTTTPLVTMDTALDTTTVSPDVFNLCLFPLKIKDYKVCLMLNIS